MCHGLPEQLMFIQFQEVPDAEPKGLLCTEMSTALIT
jgi:hypothetical protein